MSVTSGPIWTVHGCESATHLLKSFEKLYFSEQSQTQDLYHPSECMVCVLKACVLDFQSNFYCNKRAENFILAYSNFLNEAFEN